MWAGIQSLKVVSDCVCSLSFRHIENILVVIFTFIFCGGESFIVCETEGRTRGECAGGNEWGAVSYVCGVNISWWDFFFLMPSDSDSCSSYLDTELIFFNVSILACVKMRGTARPTHLANLWSLSLSPIFKLSWLSLWVYSCTSYAALKFHSLSLYWGNGNVNRAV